MPIIPSDATKLFIIPHITTSDIKCGRYEIVCTVRLKVVFFTSFKNSAKIIGSGKLHTSEDMLIVSVFFIRRGKSDDEKNCLNHFNPTHGLFITPSLGEKSLNAISAPYIGL